MNNVALWCPTHISAMASGGDLSFEYMLGVKPSLRELYEHVKISTKWFNFGVLLNLNVNLLNDINSSTESSDVKAIRMFDWWLKTSPNATRRDIIDALKKDTIGEITVANNYEMYLNELVHSSDSTTGEYIYIYIYIYIKSRCFGYNDILLNQFNIIYTIVNRQFIPNEYIAHNEVTASNEGTTPNEVSTTNEGTLSNECTAPNEDPTPYEGTVANL